MRSEFRPLLLLVGSYVLVSAVGCSEGAQGIPQGQAQYRSFRATSPPPEYSGRACIGSWGGLGADTVNGLPEMPLPNGYPRERGYGVQDGEPGPEGRGTYKVGCKVAGNGPYRIQAQLQGPNTNRLAPVTTGGTSLLINGSINDNGVGSGDVSFVTTESSLVVPLENVTCHLEAVPDPRTGERTIGPGYVWLTFRCNGATDGGGITSYCYSEGSVVLNNCDREL